MTFGETEPSEWRGGEVRLPAPANQVTFSRRELDRILDLYGRMVATASGATTPSTSSETERCSPSSAAPPKCRSTASRKIRGSPDARASRAWSRRPA